MITALTYQNTAGTIKVEINRIHHKRWYLQVFRRVTTIETTKRTGPIAVYAWQELTNKECKSLTAAQARARAAVR